MNFRHLRSKATLAFTQDRAAIAICNTDEDNFTKATGRKIAGGRLTKGRHIVSSSAPLSVRVGILLSEQRPIELRDGEIGELIREVRSEFGS